LNLVSKLIGEQPPSNNAQLMTIDAVALFPSIPIEPTIQYGLKKLEEVNVHPSIIAEFDKLLRRCLKTNLCTFKGDLYKFPEDVGVPIGSPLGSLIGDLFMDKFESEFFGSGHPLVGRIAHWSRYVDDILCL